MRKSVPNSSTHLLVILVVVLCSLLLTPAEAFRDVEDSYSNNNYFKWSPKHLYNRPMPYPAQMSNQPRRVSRYLGEGAGSGSGFSSQGYEGSLGSKNPGFIGVISSSMKRAADYKRGGCMTEGQVCLFRSGLVGAVMKLPCCPGSVCNLVDANMVCVDERKLMEAEENAEEENEGDQQEEEEEVEEEEQQQQQEPPRYMVRRWSHDLYGK